MSIATADASRLRQAACRALGIVPGLDSEPCADSGQGSKQKSVDDDKEKSKPTLKVDLRVDWKVNSWDVDGVQHWASDARLDDAILTALEAVAS